MYCDLLLFLLFKHHFVLCRSASKKCNILLYVDNLSSQVMILLSAVILNIKRMKQEKTKITSVLFFFKLAVLLSCYKFSTFFVLMFLQGKELFMDLDEGALKLIDPENLTVLNTQPIHTIRVWGVGRDNGR